MAQSWSLADSITHLFTQKVTQAQAHSRFWRVNKCVTRILLTCAAKASLPDLNARKLCWQRSSCSAVRYSYSHVATVAAPKPVVPVQLSWRFEQSVHIVKTFPRSRLLGSGQQFRLQHSHAVQVRAFGCTEFQCIQCTLT